MKYKGYLLRKVNESEIERGYYVEIYKDNKLITTAPDFTNAKEYIDSGLNPNVLC